MTGTQWTYHRCLRCGEPINTRGHFWCDRHDEQADTELAQLTAGDPHAD